MGKKRGYRVKDRERWREKERECERKSERDREKNQMLDRKRMSEKGYAEKKENFRALCIIFFIFSLILPLLFQYRNGFYFFFFFTPMCTYNNSYQLDGCILFFYL